MESRTDGLWERRMCEYEDEPGGTAQQSGPLDMVQLVVFWLLFCHVFVRRSQCMTPQLHLQTGLCIHNRAEMVL